MRVKRGEICTCDYYPEACGAHPHAMHSMIDDNVCAACGARGDHHARDCVEAPDLRKECTTGSTR